MSRCRICHQTRAELGPLARVHWFVGFLDHGRFSRPAGAETVWRSWLMLSDHFAGWEKGLCWIALWERRCGRMYPGIDAPNGGAAGLVSSAVPFLFGSPCT